MAYKDSVFDQKTLRMHLKKLFRFDGALLTKCHELRRKPHLNDLCSLLRSSTRRIHGATLVRYAVIFVLFLIGCLLWAY